MAYSTSAPPNLVVGAMGTGLQHWSYQSTHTAAEVSTAAGFFTNGKALGMRNGDELVGRTTANAQYRGVITGVSTTGATFTLYTT
jgi:hypothetical protein